MTADVLPNGTVSFQRALLSFEKHLIFRSLSYGIAANILFLADVVSSIYNESHFCWQTNFSLGKLRSNINSLMLQSSNCFTKEGFMKLKSKRLTWNIVVWILCSEAVSKIPQKKAHHGDNFFVHEHMRLCACLSGDSAKVFFWILENIHKTMQNVAFVPKRLKMDAVGGSFTRSRHHHMLFCNPTHNSN